ncbi:MAG: DUF937 domain-containing protein [Henriciella sp.]|nr:DUF937 domain-containing protein [Henriciella sp.]
MAGMNLMEMLMGAAGNGAREELGSQLGLNQDQTGMALKALIPALSAGLQSNAQQPGGIEALLGALSKGDHDQYLDQPQRLRQPETVMDGNAILGHLLGSKDMSRSVASSAAQKTGLSDQLMKAALPMVASMVMGSLSKQTKDPSVADQLMGALGGQTQQKSAGLGGLLGAVMGGGAKQQSTGGMSMLGNLLDADGDGSAMDDIFQMVMKNRR